MAESTLTGQLLWGTGLATLMSLGVGAVGTARAQDAAPEDVIVLEDITVKARRKTETLDQSPVAVSVVTDEEIGTGKTDQLLDIAKTAPNVMGSDANGMSFVIRGVGSQSVQGLASEVGVGLFQDEVYMGRPDAAPVFLNDLRQTEIVRGGQSSIYGRNTIGGAVNLVSREPGDVQSAEAELSYGSNGYNRIKAALDMPFSDGRWRTRTVLSRTDRPDGITNLATGEDDLSLKALSGRFTLMGDLTDRTQLKFTLDAETVEDGGRGGWAPLRQALRHESDLDHPAHRDDERGGVMLRLDHDFDAFSFTSITALRALSQDMLLDGDFASGSSPVFGTTPLQQGRVVDQHQLTQEFRISSYAQGDLARGELSWSTGLFFMDETYDGISFYEMAGVPSDQTSRNTLKADTRSYSVFGNVSYGLTDALTLHAGGRYTYEKKSGDVAITSPSGTFFYGMPMSGRADMSFSNFSPEVGFDYDLSDSSMVYGRISTGFKAGGVAQFFDASGNVNVYEPETTLTFEAGIKSRLFDDRMGLELTAFHTKWDDMHANVYISDFQRVTANASTAVSQGVEMSLEAALSPDLNLRATYGYLDAKFDDFRYSFYSAGSGTTQTVDYSGNPIPLAPRHSASLSLLYERQLANGLTFDASGTYSYRDQYTFDPVAGYYQPATHLLDATIGISGDDWRVSLWARNLLDEEYLSNYFLFSGYEYGIAAPGRTVGFTVSKVW